MIGMLPAVLREDDRRLSAESASEQGIKERRVLVSVNRRDVVLTEEARQSPAALPIDAGSPIQHLDDVPFAAQLLGQRPVTVEAGEDKPETIPQRSRQFSDEQFRSADVQAVNDLANRGLSQR